MKTVREVNEIVKNILESENCKTQEIDILISEIKEKIKVDKTKGKIIGPLIKELSKKKHLINETKEKNNKADQESNNNDINFILENKHIPIAQVRNKLKELTNSKSDGHQHLIDSLIEKEKQLRKLYKERKVTFIEVNKGKLSIGPRPTLTKIDELKKLGVTTIVTLLKISEKMVDELGQKINSIEINWIWFPLSAGKLSEEKIVKEKINNLYENLIMKLSQGEIIFIHCAAGIHRTGLFTNGLLRKMNFSVEDAKSKIYQMRPVTSIEAVKKHWDWSEKIIK